MKSAIAALTKKAKVTSVTTRYFFPHTNKKDKKRGKEGYACEKAELFVAACRHDGLKADFTIFDEDGTGVAVTEQVESIL